MRAVPASSNRSNLSTNRSTSAFELDRENRASDACVVRNLGGSIRRDFLGEVLQSVRFRSTVLCRAELSAPWGFTVPRRDSAGFHIVLSGRCCLEAETVSGRLWLARGDLVILPHGSAHTVRDAPGSVAPQLEDMVARSQTEPGGRLHAGGGGVRTVLVCGGLDFEERATNPLLLALPPLIHLRGRRPSVEGWLNMTFDFLERESRARRPGADAVITRLADVLFIEAVRSYFASAEAGRRGLAAALRDPRVGTALRSIHRRPEAEWEVGTLARQAGMSRTTFATRFAALVGEPPLHYVTRCRMDKAVALLRGTTATTAEIAERVGYQSERGFARAFKRFVGAAPSSYRRRPKRSRGG